MGTLDYRNSRQTRWKFCIKIGQAKRGGGDYFAIEVAVVENVLTDVVGRLKKTERN